MGNYIIIGMTKMSQKDFSVRCENCLKKVEYCKCSKDELKGTYEGYEY
jgi:hypothetical protein